jgi:addiction module HigA family antidote
LLSEFLNPLKLSQEAFADNIDLLVQRINEIVYGKRSISSVTAWLCAEALDTNPEFCLNLQTNYDFVQGGR